MIVELLHKGQQNAKDRWQLAKELNIDPRNVREQIARERARGEPIISSSYVRGYWLPDDTEEGTKELKAFRAQAVSRMVETQKTLNGIDQELRRRLG